MVNETQIGAVAFCALIVVVVIIGLIGGAFSVLHPMEYGLDLNDITRQVNEEKVFHGGRHFLGLGHSFITFPRELKIIDFSSDFDEGGPALLAGTLDGQSVTLEVTIYYQLDSSSILDLYRLYGTAYAAAFVRIAESELKNVAVTFTTDAYFNRRSDIRDSMLNAVAAKLKSVYATTHLVLLRDIGLPAGIETSLIAKIVAEQEKRTALYRQDIALINAQTEVIKAIADANITKINGEANADAKLIRERGRAEGTQLVLRTEQESLFELQQTLGFSTEEVYQYLWATRKLRVATDKDTLVVGFDQNTILNVPQPSGMAGFSSTT